MNDSLDKKLKQAQTSGISKKAVLSALSLLLIGGFLFWLLLVKGFVVMVAPQEAKATQVIAIEQGLGYVSEDKVYAVGDDVVIRVSAERFEPQLVALASAQSSNIEVVLQPSPATLMGSVNTEKGDTAWYINDQLAAVGQKIQQQLAPGNYQIVIDNPYFTPQQHTLSLERGLPYELNAQLEAVEGEIHIDSKPQGAQVFVQDQLQGKTPLTLPASGGAYGIRLEYSGYQVLEDKIEVTHSKPEPQRQYQLLPEQGRLVITTEPTGGLLLLNGSEQQTMEINVDAGRKHSLSYQKAGYYAASKSVNLKPGENRPLHFTLKAEIGKLQLQSNRPATVIANGKVIGKTPMTYQAQALPLTLKFTAKGYRTVTKTVIPKGNKTKVVKVQMLTEFEFKRQQGLPLFVDGLGIKMAKFRATPLTMGSPPNEKGRSRNEHQIKVRFSKPFWVSRHEISEAQYRAFDKSKADSKLPVTDISWLEAATYCNWLSQQEGLAPFYHIKNGRLLGVNAKAKGYRLLTEAEWEWLAKKAKRAKQTPFVWGSGERLPRKVGNFGDQSLKGAQPLFLADYNDGFAGKAPIGSFKADRVGLYDLAGNVSEWVHDRYTNTPPDTSRTYTDYLGSRRGDQFVIKGGNFKSGRLKELRAAKRRFSLNGNDTTGFRIARYD